MSISNAPGRPLQVGLFLPFGERMLDGATPRWTDLLAMARLAEAIGCDSLWVGDHMLLGGDDPPHCWEAWTLLTAIASSTTRVAIGPLVAATSFRNPAVLAKMAATLDEVSAGRLILGLGAGYVEAEYRAFGFPYDHRGGRFAEAFAIIAGLLKEGRVDLDGTYYQARECELRPRGPRPQGPPIIVGTRGARLLRLTAERADGWNGWLASATPGSSRPEAVRPLRATVDAACRAAGRDPATLGRSVTIAVNPTGAAVAAGAAPPPGGFDAITGDAPTIARALAAFAAEGIDHLQLCLVPCTLATIEALRPVLEQLDRCGSGA
jgi:alkanesulfonate monooxygenase SsuD/methylene tetrahydromethanopterin reductase-like flavin-dependent oxidoreductase (luciferase family)